MYLHTRRAMAVLTASEVRDLYQEAVSIFKSMAKFHNAIYNIRHQFRSLFAIIYSASGF